MTGNAPTTRKVTSRSLLPSSWRALASDSRKATSAHDAMAVNLPQMAAAYLCRYGEGKKGPKNCPEGLFSPGFEALKRSELLEKMAPRVRFERTTNRLTADCSTTELPRNTTRYLTLPILERQWKFSLYFQGFGQRSAKKMRPEVSPAPRRWVMVGCLQGRRGDHAHLGLTKP